jgi:8-oxo-dGTP pyrophosphatase MutT (NUDIX family)
MRLNVVLIIPYDSEKKFLLQHRTEDARILPGYWAYFGGSIHENETPQQAAEREALEEINYELKSPQLVLEQDFKEGIYDGHMRVYIENFCGDKSGLKLNEGQGWGWFSESQAESLKMIDRDRQILTHVALYLENKQAHG